MIRNVVFISISLVCISSGVHANDKCIDGSLEGAEMMDRIELSEGHLAVWWALKRGSLPAFEEAIEAHFSPLCLKKDALRLLCAAGRGSQSFLMSLISASEELRDYWTAMLCDARGEKTQAFCVRQLHESFAADNAQRARRVLDHLFTIPTGVDTWKFDTHALSIALRDVVIAPGSAVEKMLRDVGLGRYCPAAKP